MTSLVPLHFTENNKQEPFAFFFIFISLETSNPGKELSSMNQNSNQRCGCFCRPQIPAPPCMNTDCRCDCHHRCDMCDDQFLPLPARIPAIPQTQPPMPPAQPPIPQTQPPVQQAIAHARPQSTAAAAVLQPNGTAVGQNTGVNPLFPNDNINQMPVGMGYVPWQRWGQTYPVEQGFARGTIFPELDLPFVMGRCR